MAAGATKQILHIYFLFLFTYGLFNDDLSISDYSQTTGLLIMNWKSYKMKKLNELGSTWREAAVA
jgi:hypothetical protein